MHKLLKEFQQFYRENSAIWLEKFEYKEAGPHLIVMAFLTPHYCTRYNLECPFLPNKTSTAHRWISLTHRVRSIIAI
jgi:hypothetical protein